MKTTIVKWGNSQGIRLPKHLLDSAKINEDSTVEVIAENKRIIIKKVERRPRHKTIQERFSNFDGKYESISIDWGEPVSKEVW